MPILNPRQAYNLLNYKCGEIDDLIPFIISLLPIASQNYYSDINMLEIHQQFIDYLIFNSEFFSTFFNLTSEDLANFISMEESNAYQKIYEIIEVRKQEVEYNSIKLDYIGCLEQSINIPINIPKSQSFFYIPYLDENFGWFISDESFAVLIYPHSKYLKDELIMFKMRFTAFLLAAAGYILISCISFNNPDLKTIQDLIQPNFFSESHIFVEIKEISSIDLDNFLKNLKFVYFYIHYSGVDIPSIGNKYRKWDYIKTIQKHNNIYIKFFLFSKEVNELISQLGGYEINSIFYDPNSVHKDLLYQPNFKYLNEQKITVTLCNVPLYSTKKTLTDWTPIKLSGFGLGQIKKSEFNYYSSRRVLIKIGKEDYYVDFADLHLMNPELFVTEPMYLAKQNFNTYIVEKVHATYKEKTTTTENLKVKNNKLSDNIEEKMRNSFHYLYKYTKDSNGNHIEPYTSQIYAVFQAVSYMKNTNQGGIILQVHTGEGKSFIIQALAEHLARQGNTVHVATSNIILAARDFEKAYNYFSNCGRKASKISFTIQRPSILMHQEELKYIEDMINDRSIVNQQEYDAFYAPNNFNNITNMNLSVCLNNNKINSNIVYSTFLNFEALYLNQQEKNPDFENDYLNSCYLIIDEADTVLIDELTNGTILSKPMKSNAEEVLKEVYYLYSKGVDKADSVLNLIKDKFPECEDISLNDIEKMFSEIELVKSDSFCDKNKYIIAEKSDDKDKKVIIPFDSEHKGIAEHNKIFNGFIHQFAGIKEKEKDNSIEVHPLSMNYLFISHPIYVNKYKGVCGITGTIGSKKDKEILQKFYNLSPQKVPRHQMNLRNDLPMIICDNIRQRNVRICEEICSFHKLNFPVLVVFIDINEIDHIKKMLIEKYSISKNEIIVFSGSNNENSEADKNKLEENGGKSGMITLGTNFCGRGVSINYTDKPLCVIVSYYNEDKRSINQVLGRAGRNGYPGITRIICTKKMRFKTKIKYDEERILSSLHFFDVKNKFQFLFINSIRDERPWILNDAKFAEQVTARLTKKQASLLNQSNININRITAYNTKFPICMSIKSFLDIQIQRIFSLKNCPECKYTWNLFRNYIRELVFESWSLFNEQTDVKYKKMIENDDAYKNNSYLRNEDLYNKFYEEEFANFSALLSEYLPQNNNTIIKTFIYIHNKVIKDWENKIMNNIPESIRTKHEELCRDDSYTKFKIGFYPMCLAENSGARLTPLTPKQMTKAEKKNLYIIDPELRYIKKGSINKRFSITVMIDKIFEKFQEVVDEKLQGLFGIRFFLRRTLVGCEFGVCVDPMYECKDDFLNCLIDRNPIIMLTICTKSSTPWIAGILMIVLVFVVSISVMIGKRIINPSTLPTDILNLAKKAWLFFTNKKDEEKKLLDPLSAVLNPIFDALIKHLQSLVIKNIFKIDKGLSIIFETILNIFVPFETEEFDDKISNRVFSKIKINQKAMDYMKGTSPFGKMIKIGILFVLLIALFILNFKHRKRLEFESSTKSEANSFLKENKKSTLNSSNDLIKYNSYKKAELEVNDEINVDFKVDEID